MTNFTRKHSMSLPLLFVVLPLVIGSEIGDPCQVATLKGVCLPFSQCETLASAMKNGFLVPSQIPNCGLTVFEEMICCPLPEEVTTRTPVSATRLNVQKLRPAEVACNSFQQSLPPSLISHIFGGIPVEAGEFPHMAALGYPNIGGSGLDFRCGGSLIDVRFVLTAAHCVHNKNNQPTVVRLGVLDINDAKNALDIEIKSIYVHPLFVDPDKYYDIAVIELKTPATVTDFVRPACLVTDPTRLSPSAQFYVSGWGTQGRSNVRRSEKLLKAPLQVIGQSQCSSSYMPHIKDAATTLPRGILPSQICAGGSEKSPADSCSGDSGGPLSVLNEEETYEVAGIVSAGVSCGSNIPGLYTNVTSFLDFIEEICWP